MYAAKRRTRRTGDSIRHGWAELAVVKRGRTAPFSPSSSERFGRACRKNAAGVERRAGDCDPVHMRTVVWALPKPERPKFEGRFPMAMFWLSTALGALGVAAIMFAIPRDDAQLLGRFPESNPGDRDPTDSKR